MCFISTCRKRVAGDGLKDRKLPQANTHAALRRLPKPEFFGAIVKYLLKCITEPPQDRPSEMKYNTDTTVQAGGAPGEQGGGEGEF